jgi:hypothetical protein
MTDEIEKLMRMNQSLLLLLGYATGLLKIPECTQKDDEYWSKCQWLNKAIENVVYLDKPLPKMP